MAYTPKYFRGWHNIQFPTINQDDESKYDPKIAWWLAQCSQLSYENKITVATELRAANFTHVVFFDNEGTQAFLAVHPGVSGGSKFAVLAFRGTEQDSIDILTDINFVTRLFPDENLVEEPTQEPEALQKEPNKKDEENKKLYAHGGFLKGVLNVWGCALRQEIKTIYPNVSSDWKGAPGISNAICELGLDTPLYFTGHSLGGALATLAVYKALVYKSNVKINALYTFGSPRTAQRPLAKAINKELSGKLYRVVNYIDVVPRLPPRIPVILAFRHIEKLIYFNKNREPQELSQPGIFLGDVSVLLLAILEVAISWLSFKKYVPRTIQKHMIDEYIKDIEHQIGLKATN
ncbi:MAG TPA: hypothetical protein DD379_11145 [Cyanobacteria bacterium UBA11162]|nr:hypothetical protein [Cyanobacteria bacterium UBA11162]